MEVRVSGERVGRREGGRVRGKGKGEVGWVGWVFADHMH